MGGPRGNAGRPRAVLHIEYTEVYAEDQAALSMAPLALPRAKTIVSARRPSRVMRPLPAVRAAVVPACDASFSLRTGAPSGVSSLQLLRRRTIMPKLNQIIAIQAGKKSQAKDTLTEAYHLLKKSEIGRAHV